MNDFNSFVDVSKHDSANNQRFYSTARTTLANNGWRNKASVAVLGSAVLGFGALTAKEVYCDAVVDDNQRVKNTYIKK